MPGCLWEVWGIRLFPTASSQEMGRVALPIVPVPAYPFFAQKKKAYPPVFSGVLPSFPACTQAFPCSTPFLHVQEILLRKTLRCRDPVPDAHIHHPPVMHALLRDTLLVPAFPVHHIQVEPACRIVTRLQ